MSIRFECPHCSEQLSVPDEYSGRQAKCIECGKECVVPVTQAKSMIRCKDCGKEISRLAKLCPHCGAPSAQEKRAIIAKGLFGISASLLVLGCSLPFAAMAVLMLLAALGLLN